MDQDSQSVREWVDFFFAIGAWAVSLFVMFSLLRMFILPHIMS